MSLQLKRQAIGSLLGDELPKAFTQSNIGAGSTATATCPLNPDGDW